MGFQNYTNEEDNLKTRVYAHTWKPNVKPQHTNSLLMIECYLILPHVNLVCHHPLETHQNFQIQNIGPLLYVTVF